MTLGSLSSLPASIILLAAWGFIGLCGLLRPSSILLVRRVLFPAGALVGAG